MEHIWVGSSLLHKYKAKMEVAATTNALAYNTTVLKYRSKDRTQQWMLYNFKLECLSLKSFGNFQVKLAEFSWPDKPSSLFWQRVSVKEKKFL